MNHEKSRPDATHGKNRRKTRQESENITHSADEEKGDSLHGGSTDEGYCAGDYSVWIEPVRHGYIWETV